MTFREEIEAAESAPKQIERLFQSALKEKREAEFRADLITCHRAAPDNLLYAAWFHRLRAAAADSTSARRKTNWKLALPLSLASGSIMWLLSAERLVYQPEQMPYLAQLAAPILAILTMAYLSATSGRGTGRALRASAGLAAAVAYVMLLSPENDHYRLLMAPHLLLLSWAAVGVSVIGAGASARERFSFLIKSVEVFVTGGVFLIATFVFSGIALSMFAALDVEVGDAINRLMFVGLGAAVPLLAVASAYDPLLSPARQEFTRGVGRLIITFPRVLLALSIVVLAVYLVAILFNFMAPFEHRDVLIIYNVMLFAVMGLLLGATPVTAADLSARLQSALRKAIMVVAVMVVIVSLYALAAVIYRTVGHGLTVNRMTVIGWNSVNIGLLVLLLYRQLRRGRKAWVRNLQKTFGDGIFAYTAWGVFVTIAAPWLF
ncbi:MAG: hypothetical protein QF376_03250 [Anaerolineales bacterium]|jgi:hypothetical protein|nr:hypothetical protein [Anaerolineales bacterium]HJO32609.1 hypothetical protein [Anaerolineales bacterium]